MPTAWRPRANTTAFEETRVTTRQANTRSIHSTSEGSRRVTTVHPAGSSSTGSGSWTRKPPSMGRRSSPGIPGGCAVGDDTFLWPRPIPPPWLPGPAGFLPDGEAQFFGQPLRGCVLRGDDGDDLGQAQDGEADVEDSQASLASITPAPDGSLKSVPKVDFTHAVDVMKTREADEALCLGFDDTPVAEAVASGCRCGRSDARRRRSLAVRRLSGARGFTWVISVGGQVCQGR